MTRRVPAERTLPRKQEILKRILADEQVPARRRGRLVPVVAAASIAAVVGGALVVTSPGLGNDPAGQTPSGPPPTQQSAPESAQPSVQPSAQGSVRPPARRDDDPSPGIPIDRGRLTKAQAAQAAKNCLEQLGNLKVDAILHPALVAQARSGRSVPALVVRSGDRFHTCVGPAPGQSVWDVRTRQRPLQVELGSIDVAGISRGGRLETVEVVGWTAVDEKVATVRRRVVTNGKPGPWYATSAVDGLAYIWAKADQVLRVGDKVSVETEQLDPAGWWVGEPSVVTGTVTDRPPADGGPDLEFSR